MGGPKALMQVHGQPWWRLQLQRLAAAGLESLWIASPEVAAAWTNTSDAPRHLTTTPAAEAGHPSTPEPLPMFASLMLGVGALASLPRVLLVLPVDVPCPSHAVIEALIAATASGVSLPSHQGRTGHPIALSRPWIESNLLPPDRHDVRVARLDHLVRDSARMLQVDDPCVLVNLNTPTDLEAWLDS